jgi:N-formylglutamate deformylase
MPNIAVSRHESIPGVDIVLGDRFGRSARHQTLELLENAFLSAGFTVKRNDPYAGGYIAQNYGVPDSGIDCVQIEINRRLYMNESRIEKNGDFDYVAGRLCQVWHKIASEFPAASAQENLLAAE